MRIWWGGMRRRLIVIFLENLFSNVETYINYLIRFHNRGELLFYLLTSEEQEGTCLILSSSYRHWNHIFHAN